MALQINKEDYRILCQILSKYPYQFYAYGSHSQGTTRKFSDLDLCYREEIPYPIVNNIKEELEESDLPFIVELVNWNHMEPNFQQLIKEDLIKL